MIMILACNLTLRTGSPASGSTASQGAATAAPSDRILPTGTATATAEPVANWPPTVDEILAECPTAAEIAEVDSQIDMRFRDDPTAGRLVCTAAAGSADLTREQKNAYNAVLIMKELKFDAPLPWTDQPLYDWFTDSVDSIIYRGDIRNPAFDVSKSTIWMKADPQAFHSDRWTAVSSLVGLYVHEARHAVALHTCTKYQDKTIAELGATGVETRFYEWLAYHSDAAFLTEFAPGPTTDYREASRFKMFHWMSFNFCDDPTPAVPPPIVAPPRQA